MELTLLRPSGLIPLPDPITTLYERVKEFEEIIDELEVDPNKYDLVAAAKVLVAKMICDRFCYPPMKELIAGVTEYLSNEWFTRTHADDVFRPLYCVLQIGGY